MDTERLHAQKSCMQQVPTCFAVATVLEGVALREAGQKLPILLLSEPPTDAIDALLEHEIMPSVYSPEFAWAYGERAASLARWASTTWPSTRA